MRFPLPPEASADRPSDRFLDGSLDQKKVAIADLPLPMLLLDGQGNISDANMLAEEQLGTSVRKLAGRHLSDFFEPSSEVNTMLERVSQGEMVTYDTFSNRLTHLPIHCIWGLIKKVQHC